VACSFHAFGGEDAPAHKIDYILANTDVTPCGVRVWNDGHEGMYLSDHDPICADIILKGETEA